jgi:hypothetical protein
MDDDFKKCLIYYIYKDIIKGRAKEIDQIIQDVSLNYNKFYIFYILPFTNGEYFKFGITKNINLSRISNLNTLFGIDFSKSIILYGSGSDIKRLEKKLKNSLPIIEKYKGISGYTEIKDILTLPYVIEESIKVEGIYIYKDFSKESLNNNYTLNIDYKDDIFEIDVDDIKIPNMTDVLSEIPSFDW